MDNEEVVIQGLSDESHKNPTDNGVNFDSNGHVFKRCPSLDDRKKTMRAKILSFPKAVFFCLGCEFSERFSYYGTRSIMVLYFMSAKGLLPAQAKLLYHAFICLAHFTPLLGSILADGFFGKFKVIFSLSLIYCVGHVLITIGALPQLSYMLSAFFDFGGFLIISVASGGMRPCVAAFAGDQFGPKMEKERQQFFSFYYFAINLGALLAYLVTPALRAHVHCFGQMTCFPLAFLLPSVFIFFSTILFISGKKIYIIHPPTKNILGEVFGCIYYAIKEKLRLGKLQKKNHWLNYAFPKYSMQVISDIKVLLSIALLYVPIILFAALYDQMGSTWVLQGNMMNGRLGRLTILPDQLSLLNAILILILVPIFEGLIYPFLNKLNILKTPLSRMGWGGIVAASTFVVAGFLQLAINNSMVPMPHANEGRLVFYNMLSENASLSNAYAKLVVEPGVYRTIDLNDSIKLESYSDSIRTEKGLGSFVVLTPYNTLLNVSYSLDKTTDGQTRLYILHDLDFTAFSVEVSYPDHSLKTVIMLDNTNSSRFVDLEPGFFGSKELTLKIKLPLTDKEFVGQINNLPQDSFVTLPLDAGSAFVIVVLNNGVYLIPLIVGNQVNILWQCIPYFMITIAEILFLITGLDFSYSQAPESMKTVVQAMWLLTMAFGNLLAAVISGSNMVSNPAVEFFLYAGMMFLVMIAFIILAGRYKYVDELKNNTEKTAEELVALNNGADH